MTALSLLRVTKSFGQRNVVHETTIELCDGEQLALIGPSGCGKSTLLRMILGLVIPDSGTVRVGDAVVTKHSAPAIRRRIGYVIQDGGLFPHLTARANVTLVSRLDGACAADAIEARVRELAETVRIPVHLLDRHPSELSGGERQRVGLMRALMLDPGLLLLDEPLGALDPIVRACLQEDLRSVFRSLGKTVLVVTHDMAEAAYLTDSIAVMRDGAILQRGTMSVLSHAPEHPFVREFVTAQRAQLAFEEALR